MSDYCWPLLYVIFKTLLGSTWCSYFYRRWGYWGTERSEDLTKVIQLVIDGAGIEPSLDSRAYVLNHKVLMPPWAARSSMIMSTLI